jgi:hypothetical protein
MEANYSRARSVFIGAIAGVATCATYPALVVVPLPLELAAVLGAAFGPLLGAASWGLREFFALWRRTLATDLAAAANAIAGALFSAMVLVQLAVEERTDDDPSDEVEAVWLGLDVAWDAYIGLGTILFAAAALGHPRLGRSYAIPGFAIGVALLALNLASFPTPPADAGSVDVGPLVGIWYFALTIVMFRSGPWAREAEAAESAGAAVTGE